MRRVTLAIFAETESFAPQVSQSAASVSAAAARRITPLKRQTNILCKAALRFVQLCRRLFLGASGTVSFRDGEKNLRFSSSFDLGSRFASPIALVTVIRASTIPLSSPFRRDGRSMTPDRQTGVFGRLVQARNDSGSPYARNQRQHRETLNRNRQRRFFDASANITSTYDYLKRAWLGDAKSR